MPNVLLDSKGRKVAYVIMDILSGAIYEIPASGVGSVSLGIHGTVCGISSTSHSALIIHPSSRVVAYYPCPIGTIGRVSSSG